MRPLCWLVLLVIAGSSGCVYTSTPLGTPTDQVFEESLLGIWEPVTSPPALLTLQGEKVVIARKGPREYSYEYHDSNGVKRGTFHLLKLGNTYFFEEQVGKEKFFALRLALLGDQLRYRPFDDDGAREAARALPGIRVTTIYHGGPVFSTTDYFLDGPAQDVRQLFLKKIPLSEQYGALRRLGADKVTGTGLASKKQRTYEAWLELKRQMARGILGERIPTTAADREVASLAERFAAALQRVEQLRQKVLSQGETPEKTAYVQDAFGEGYYGDPFRAHTVYPQEWKAWKEGKRLRAETRKVGQVLTKRYGLEFP